MTTEVSHLSAVLKGPDFDRIGSETLRKMLDDATELSFVDGATVVEQGAALDCPLVLLEGDVEFTNATADRPFGMAPSFLGDPSLFENKTWPVGIKAKGACRVLRLDFVAVRRAIAADPKAFMHHPVFAQIARQQTLISEALKLGSTLKSVGDEVRKELMCTMRLRLHPGGSMVMRKGEDAHFGLIVISGMLRVSVETADGNRQFYGNYIQGASVGEIGLILNQPRSADVVAARDTVVAVVDRAIWERVVQLSPVVMTQVASKLVFDHMSPVKPRATSHLANTFSVVPLTPGVDIGWLTRALRDAFSVFGSVRVIQAQHIADNDDAGQDDPFERIQHLERFSEGVDFVVFEAEPKDTGWSRFCLRAVDNILLVANEDITTPAHWIAPLLHGRGAAAMINQALIELLPDRPGSGVRSYAVPQWAQNLQRFNIRRTQADDVARMVRLLTGHAVGLVLGGGGARGFAQIGVLRALQEARLPVDLIGGNSMGALLGAQVALERPLDQILEDTRALGMSGERPTVPVVSLVGGHRLRSTIHRLVGDTPIETLWRDFFAVSCNLSSATVTTIDHGPIWQAVLASNSPAGIAPPFLHDGRLLVDGAILNNFPVDVMRARMQQGVVLGIDVNPRDDMSVGADLQTLSPWRVLAQRLGLSSGAPLPGITDILHRAGTIGGMAHRERVRGHADLILEPPVQEFSLMGYSRAAAIADVGYRCAMENMEQIEQTLQISRKNSDAEPAG